MPSFFERLEARVNKIDSLLCLGLDPHPQDLHEQTPQALHDFCLRLLEKTGDQVAAVKPNSAFFEAFGAQGISVLKEVIRAVPDDILVILDAKRGDIASTAQAYAQAAFRQIGADAITASPYLGYDSIEPFLEQPGKGVFMLCKTSNPGSKDLQDMLVSSPGGTDILLYEHVARLAQSWNINNNLGVVVGATHPEALTRVRAAAPDLWFLTPGVGAQGGNLESALRAGLRPDGLGMLIPVSRAISRAADPQKAASELRQAINQERKNITSAPSLFSTHDLHLNMLADMLLESGCVKFGQFTLKSGLQSPIYIDLRQLVGYPKVLSEVANAYLPILQSLAFDRLAALPYTALPIAAVVSLQGSWPMVYPRKEVKEYGTRAQIEGVYKSGEKVAVIDD
ncbi:MAG: orotidine-5'-phosphate decarboxylase, partial [Anaerolineales bacterium]|nr:orotidine-5'-phosphate decarboxylase [Anaerolineales bacterium]